LRRAGFRHADGVLADPNPEEPVRLAALLVPACLVAVVLPSIARAQTTVLANSNVMQAFTQRANFAIPDAPAFQLLEVDPSTILRPSTPREVAVNLSKFFAEDGSFSLPQKLAIELPPILLIKRDLSQKELDKNPFLYSLRFSFAGERHPDTGAPARMAFGFRLHTLDETPPAQAFLHSTISFAAGDTLRIVDGDDTAEYLVKDTQVRVVRAGRKEERFRNPQVLVVRDGEVSAVNKKDLQADADAVVVKSVKNGKVKAVDSHGKEFAVKDVLDIRDSKQMYDLMN
jgi:hypothetical protein